MFGLLQSTGAWAFTVHGCLSFYSPPMFGLLESTLWGTIHVFLVNYCKATPLRDVKLHLCVATFTSMQISRVTLIMSLLAKLESDLKSACRLHGVLSF